MTFFGVVGVLGQLVVAAMGAIVILTGLTLLAGIAVPGLLDGLVH